MQDKWFHKVFSIQETDFEQLVIEIFRFQYENNSVYRSYCDMVKTDVQKVNNVLTIPFLPIQFYKTHIVKTTQFEPEVIFESSGTTQTINSHHFVKDLGFYRQSFVDTFELFYGSEKEWCIIGLLPSYLERKKSSLVFMVDELIRRSGHTAGGFYLYDHDKLHSTLEMLEAEGQKTLLIGVSFALLDFSARYPMHLKHTTVMETGGMKGRKQEMVRSELHEILKKRFDLDSIHSEYGMTELLSQAYSKASGIFHCPPWMKILIRDEEDPFQVINSPLATHDSRLTQGAINIIDLANVYSCSFIATDDAGRLYDDGSFEVIGRLDNSDIRGCSLMTIEI